MPFPGKFPRTPILCYVTDRKSLPASLVANPQALIERIAAATKAGVDWIQIREKDLCASEISGLVRESLALAKQAQQENHAPKILVNDRLDVAVAERAGGVHLGENSLPAQTVSHWIGSLANRPGLQNFLVGVSCHSLAGAIKAQQDGANYIFFGPVFVTPSKVSFGTPQGLGKLREVCSAVSLPVLAIGGIALENVTSCLGAGASGIAAIRLFQDAADMPALIAHLRAARS